MDALASRSKLRDSISVQQANRMKKQAVRDSTKGKEADVVNPRVYNMFREALEFKGAAIIPLEEELRGLESATIEFTEGMLPLLQAPLPRVWDRVGSGPLAEPLRASATHYGHPDLAGGHMDDAAVRASVAEFERNLQLKVRRPLSQWVNALEGVRGRVPELERLRGNLEQRLRKVKSQEKRKEKEERKRAGVRRAGRGFAVGKTGGIKTLFYKCTHPTADLDTQGVPPAEGEPGMEPSRAETLVSRQDYKREDQDVKYKEEMRKLQAATEAFSSDEGLLYEQLGGLCRDAAWIKSYVASALLMCKELFQEVAIELGDSVQPLPACKVPSPEAALLGLRMLAPAGPEPSMAGVSALLAQPQQKTLGSNLTYIAAMPDYAQRGRARATLDEFKESARKRLHAHMATSSPLELHALPQARAGDLPGRPGSSQRALSAADVQEQQQLRAKAQQPMAAGGLGLGTATPPKGVPTEMQAKLSQSPDTPATPAHDRQVPQGLLYT